MAGLAAGGAGATGGWTELEQPDRTASCTNPFLQIYPRTPMERVYDTRVSEKCVGCDPAVEEGYQPMCVQNCIGMTRILGFIDPPWRMREDDPVDWRVHDQQIALPCDPQLGLEPNIDYIPPVHAERDSLRQRFGPQVDGAIERHSKLESDPVAQGLRVLMGSSDRILHSFSVESGTARGFAEDGSEVVSVPVTEPIHERAAWDEARGAVRTDTP